MAQKIRITLTQAIDRVLADHYPRPAPAVPPQPAQLPRMEFAPAA